MIKLIGSLKEKEIRERLNVSRISLLDSESKKKLRNILISNNYILEEVLVVRHIPEQDCDCYTLLTSGNIVLKIDVSKESKEYTCVELDLKRYYEKCSRVNKLVLSVAVDILNPQIHYP